MLLVVSGREAGHFYIGKALRSGMLAQSNSSDTAGATQKARQPIALGFAVPLPIGRDMYCSGRCLSTISLTVGEGLELHDGADG